MESVNKKDINTVEVEGYICQTPTFRCTPLGRQVTDILLAADGNYFQCVIYGQDAKQASRKHVGDYICIQGRIQCREYIKDEAVHKVVEIVSNKLSFE